jgi:hypothetical protein
MSADQLSPKTSNEFRKQIFGTHGNTSAANYTGK